MVLVQLMGVQVEGTRLAVVADEVVLGAEPPPAYTLEVGEGERAVDEGAAPDVVRAPSASASAP